jgi:hypothetical protein
VLRRLKQCHLHVLRPWHLLRFDVLYVGYKESAVFGFQALFPNGLPIYFDSFSRCIRNSLRFATLYSVSGAKKHIFTVSSPLSYLSLTSNIPSHIKAHVTKISHISTDLEIYVRVRNQVAYGWMQQQAFVRTVMNFRVDQERGIPISFQGTT